MMEKTHLAAGIAAALIVIQPQTRMALTCAMAGGALGGLFSDIDVKADSSRYAEMTAAALTLAFLGADWLTDGGVVMRLAANRERALAGLVLEIMLFIIGRAGEHRGRTHSFAFMGLTSLSFLLIDADMALAFAIGYLSHLLTDLLNMQPEKLMYPSQKGYCLKLCRADGFANELLFALCVSVSAGYMLLILN